MAPGATAVTQMPYGPNSRAKDLVIQSMAPLEAMYGTKPSIAPLRVIDVKFMIFPHRLAFIEGAQIFDNKNAAAEFTRN